MTWDGWIDAGGFVHEDTTPVFDAERRTFVIFLCHACGYAVNEEMGDLSCARCGEPRSMIEEVKVQEVEGDG